MASLGRFAGKRNAAEAGQVAGWRRLVRRGHDGTIAADGEALVHCIAVRYGF